MDEKNYRSIPLSRPYCTTRRSAFTLHNQQNPIANHPRSKSYSVQNLGLGPRIWFSISSVRESTVIYVFPASNARMIARATSRDAGTLSLNR